MGAQGATEMEEGAEDKKETTVSGGKESPAAASAASRKTPASPAIDKGAGGDNNDSKMVTGKNEEGKMEHSSDNLDYFLSGSIPKLLTVSILLLKVVKGIFNIWFELLNSGDQKKMLYTYSYYF